MANEDSKKNHNTEKYNQIQKSARERLFAYQTALNTIYENNMFSEISSENQAEYLKKIRKQLKLSQSRFSETFGIPVRTLQQWEQGRSKCPVYVIRMLDMIVKLSLENEELKRIK